MIRAALFMLAACGHAHPLFVEPAPAIFDATARAVNAINEAAASQLVTVAADSGRTVWVLPAEECGEFKGNEIHAGRCGYEDSEPIVIVHEIGHALGLEHSADPDSVMFAKFHMMALPDAARSLVAELHHE